MEFEWDDAKREANLVKHGIDFITAISIWSGPTIDPAGCKVVGDEARNLAIGAIGTDHIVIAVVYTLRGKVRRVISARRARRDERKAYQDFFGAGI